MERSGSGSRLIILCGLPGSGKTTLGKALEGRLHAIRFAPDEWMAALSLDIYDEERRAKVEALQWKLSKELLALGLTAYLSAPVDVLFDRIQRRSIENPPIERDALAQWFEQFQIPTPEEMALFDKPLIADLASD